MQITSRSTPNIALIKYWGNQDNRLRLPAAESLSITLNTPRVEVTADAADQLSVHSYQSDGTEKSLTEKDIQRFANHLTLCREYCSSIGLPDALPAAVALEIRSAIPPSVGLASSAAVFSAVAQAYTELIAPTRALTPTEISVLARLGSGSACRSVLGGYVAIRTTGESAIDAAYAEQIADEHHWTLHDIVVIPSEQAKKVGSTEGHAVAQSSPLFADRIRAIPNRMQEAESALLNRDFEKLQAVTEADCWDMHKIMETSTPALRYLSKETHRIVRDITDLRTSAHLPVLYTMDAGPTVHLICTDEALADVTAFAHHQSGCTVFETTVGAGSSLL